ncbi:MAG: NAD(P)-dependent glycerol-3-phosphate dehydrogenase [Planctomycetes bacterium]|nr:NAD(P)-dependent glycerol-3-phosphate dehydrogenase [Planctomycetota bacterium]
MATAEKICVIGDGGMGTVCAIMLAENGHDVVLWSAFAEQARQLAADGENKRFLPGAKLPDRVRVTADDAEAFAGVSMAISAVPAQFVRGVWQRLGSKCPADLAICSVAKGIENGTLLRPTEVLADVLGGAPGRALAALSGPSIAPEVAKRLPATVVVAATEADLAVRVQGLVSRPYFRVYTNPDLLGVEIAGATKNVIAIAAGILDGMKVGDNAKAGLVSRGLSEITRLGVAMGAQAETFAGLAGIGDLVTTCISPLGRNRSFGEAIGRGLSVDEALAAAHGVVEGVATTESVMALAKRYGAVMPITSGIYDVIFNHVAPRTAIRKLMSRPLKAE